MIAATATVTRLEFYIWRLKYTFKVSTYYIHSITAIVFHVCTCIVFLARVVSLVDWVYNNYLDYLNIINTTFSLFVSVGVTYLFNKKLLALMTQHMAHERNSIHISQFYKYDNTVSNDNVELSTMEVYTDNHNTPIGNGKKYKYTMSGSSSNNTDRDRCAYEQSKSSPMLESMSNIAVQHQTTMAQVKAWKTSIDELERDDKKARIQYKNQIALLHMVTKQTILVTLDVLITIVTLFCYLGYYVVFKHDTSGVVFWIAITVDFTIIPLILWLSFKFAQNQYQCMCKHNHAICLDCCKYAAMWKMNSIHVQWINEENSKNGGGDKSNHNQQTMYVRM